jgi:hypothetical protein
MRGIVQEFLQKSGALRGKPELHMARNQDVVPGHSFERF